MNKKRRRRLRAAKLDNGTEQVAVREEWRGTGMRLAQKRATQHAQQE
jgi:hypothetical protein